MSDNAFFVVLVVWEVMFVLWCIWTSYKAAKWLDRLYRCWRERR